MRNVPLVSRIARDLIKSHLIFFRRTHADNWRRTIVVKMIRDALIKMTIHAAPKINLHRNVKICTLLVGVYRRIDPVAR